MGVGLSQRLALKYRPRRFAEVLGQDPTVRVLTAALQTSRLPSAVLLTGIRGCGKTTLARIVAKSLNCEHLQGVEPCLECPSCKSIDAGTFSWVREIDAASYRGIDDVRKLMDVLQYAPPPGSRFVLIMDECHQLTDAASQALLKSLEEPQPWAYFVLCTTEPESLLDTIRSRCMKFYLRTIGTKELGQIVTSIVGREGVEIEASALYAICSNAGGSIRDALTLVEPALLTGTKVVTEQDVQSVCSLVNIDSVADLMDCVAVQDVAGVIRQVGQLLRSGSDPQEIFSAIGRYWHDLALIVNDCLSLVEYSDRIKVRMLDQTQQLGRTHTMFLLQFWSERSRSKVSDWTLTAYLLTLCEILKSGRRVLEEHAEVESMLRRFVAGHEDRVQLEWDEKSGLWSLKGKEKLINVVVTRLEAVSDYYITVSDVRRLGSFSKLTSEIKKKTDK